MADSTDTAMSHQRRRRTVVIGVVLGLSLALGVGLPGIGNMLLTNTLIATILIFTVVLVSRCNNKCCCACCRDGDAGQRLAGLHESMIETLPVMAVDPPTGTPRPPRAVYLDNIKVVLTAIVVHHHCTLALGAQGGWFFAVAGNATTFSLMAVWINGLDQSYFMCLFFFISGLFTPSSYDRHMNKGTGVWGFLRDKCLRLGIPFLCFAFVCGPLLDFVVHAAIIPHLEAGGGNSAGWQYFYNVNPGPPWFLAWLLLLNFAYAFRGGARSAVPVAPPRLPTIVFCCALLGLLDFLLSSALGGNFAMMPLMGLGGLPFDLVFFAAGCCASPKRSAWLDPAVDWWDKVELPAFVGVCALASGYLASTVTSVVNLTTKDRSKPPNSGVAGASSVELLGVCAYGGMCTALIPVWMLATSRKRFNFTTPRLTSAANAAYTVYLIHPWVVVLTTWIYVVYLHTAGEVDFVFANGSSTSFTVTGPPSLDRQWDGYVWRGYLFVAVVSQLLVWPLAHIFRSLPLVRRVL